MFQHILVPLDGSPLAEMVLPHVVALARSGAPRVTLLRVLDPISSATRPLSVDPFEWQIRKAEVETYLKNIGLRLQALEIATEHQILEGRAAERVIEYAHQNKVDLIILSSHGQSGISGWNVSSVVQKVTLRAQTSVMLIRAYAEQEQGLTDLHYERIMLPLDGSQRAECVLPLATSLAEKYGAELVAVHVVKKPEMPRRTPLSAEDAELLERVADRNRIEAEKYFDDLRQRIHTPLQTRILVSENLAASLHDAVEQNEIDLVILSAHGYTGETRWPYGSMVISFIAYGTTPLLIYQDLPADRIETTRAEEAAQEHGGR